ncbi:NAD(P)/FAD-dependent oxidoreductase [Candidatus Finniella inopinata]|uniref:NAD(P)/FAD-dependent oxidoreductase n=1 Tax=Candidatus Finniella inopinata TaxID=1696036 RepID=A0A4Q7DJN2_9PROT|nr:NAD(P)/FAD-dependent oxidoreductase [Candidatus Finniella inopinata]RZI46548.1 NAD(P)/FAD-dependent oxidoreductase [Candidatus Finniella inopinata]
MNICDVIVIGAGAAGLMAAATAAKRGRRVILIEHTNKIGEKIRISGGGRSNFTNLFASPKNYISRNPHFAKSALASYTQHDFIKLVESYNIAYHEKTLGQLFCDGSSKQIINMLLSECQKGQVDVRLNCAVTNIAKGDHFKISTSDGILSAESVIIATGGLSIPPIGATDFGYKIARQFGLKVLATQPALVPLKVPPSTLHMFTSLSGISVDAIASYHDVHFRENILFTHRGLSGPAILQISSYMQKFSKEEITLNLLPDIDLKDEFKLNRNSKQTVGNFLKNHFPNRLVETMATPDYGVRITELKNNRLFEIADSFHQFKVTIDGSEGYQKAEVTVGGIDTDELSSKTLMSTKVPQLFFIGEVVDVTGWLGGYNFQWAWSSGYCAGQHC